MKLDYPYLVEDMDRNGNVRTYVRMPGQKKVRLRETPGTPEFSAAYWAARKQEPLPPSAIRPKARPGTFGWLVEHYYQSAEFRKLNKEYTQVERERQLNPLVAKHGHQPAIIDQKTIRLAVKKREAEGKSNAKARKFLAALRDVYRAALDSELVNRDPTFGIRTKKPTTDGFHSWTLAECLKYEKRHALGTQARTAYAIGLYCLARRSDAVRLGKPFDRGDKLVYRQEKNRDRAPVWVEHPIVPPLREALNAWQGKNLTWLETSFGRPFTKFGFGAKFREWCDEAGLPKCSFHGLRKATAARMAEEGYSSAQIKAALGDKTMQQAEVYTRGADNARMASDAMGGLYSERKVPLSKRVVASGTKRRKNAK